MTSQESVIFFASHNLKVILSTQAIAGDDLLSNLRNSSVLSLADGHKPPTGNYVNLDNLMEPINQQQH